MNFRSFVLALCFACNPQGRDKESRGETYELRLEPAPVRCAAQYGSVHLRFATHETVTFRIRGVEIEHFRVCDETSSGAGGCGESCTMSHVQPEEADADLSDARVECHEVDCSARLMGDGLVSVTKSTPGTAHVIVHAEVDGTVQAEQNIFEFVAEDPCLSPDDSR